MNNNKQQANLNEALRTSIDQISEEIVDSAASPAKFLQNINSGKSIREIGNVNHTLESFGINMEQNNIFEHVSSKQSIPA